MKRWLTGLLLILVLTGCNQQPAPTTEPTVPAPTAKPTSLYMQNSALEVQTGGAVLSYPLNTDGCIGLRPMGERILVLSLDDAGILEMTVLSGESGIVEASAKMEGVPTESIQTAGDRIACYNMTENSILILDAALHITERIFLPKGVEGDIRIDETLSNAYYCTGQQVRAIDLTTEVPRLVHQHTCQQQSIQDVILNGTVLICSVTDDEGSYWEFIDTATGQTMGKDSSIGQLSSYQDRFFLCRAEGPLQENLFRIGEGSLQQLNVTSEQLHGLPAMNAAIAVNDQDGGLEISCFDLRTGLLASQAILPDLHAIYCLTATAESSYVWFLYEDAALSQDILCRWDISFRSSHDNTVYTGPRYTADAPDTEGIARCTQWAQRLNETYHVNIVFDNTLRQSEDYTLVPEYQVPLLEQGLHALETALSAMPEDFVKTLSKVSDSPLSIALVRSIRSIGGHAPADGTGLQYWSGKNACIALCVTDTVLQDFYHQLFHILEVYLYSESTQLDLWNQLNPKGFSYDHSYLDYEQHTDSKYLQEKNRAFIDAFSMTYAREDRARIFEYAMMEGNEAFFSSETMQDKLHQLCYCIRDAYGLRKSESTYPWEQYLEKSLAYTKRK